MSRIFFCLVTGILFFSCGNNDEKKVELQNVYTNDPVYKKGVALVGKNKCLTCHAIDETITGPAYTAIGIKYENASDSLVSVLAGKVITGGTGVWGPGIMIPHPGVTQEEAETMVRYILLLGKNSK